MNLEETNNSFSSTEKPTNTFQSTNILSQDGGVLSTVRRNNLDETNTTTLHSANINKSQESNTINTATTVISDEKISEKKYEFSYSQLEVEVDKQVKGKLQDFLDKNQEIVDSIKSDLGHHKEKVDTRVSGFQQILDVLTNNKQFSKSTTLTRIGLIVGAVIVGVQIYIEVVNDKFNTIAELQRDMSVLQNKVEKLDEDSDENSDELKKIEDIINKINVDIAKLDTNTNQENSTDTE